MIDIGANLTHDSFAADRDAVLERARAAGVDRLIVTGTTLDASRQAIELASERPGTLFATAGVHPHRAIEFDAKQAAALRELVASPVVVAVGECGLDYFRDYSPRAAQLDAFAAQLEIAAAVQKPVFLHQRDAHEAFLELVATYWPRLAGGVAHCFTGNAGELSAYLDLGLHIGITGWICDERRGAALRDAVRQLPLDRLLLETDAPYLLPRDLAEKPPGRRNEPATLAHIANTLAHYMGAAPDAVAAAATRNAEQLFGLADRAQRDRSG